MRFAYCLCYSISALIECEFSPHACERGMERVGVGEEERVRSGYWHLPLFVSYSFLCGCKITARAGEPARERERDGWINTCHTHARTHTRTLDSIS